MIQCRDYHKNHYAVLMQLCHPVMLMLHRGVNSLQMEEWKSLCFSEIYDMERGWGGGGGEEENVNMLYEGRKKTIKGVMVCSNVVETDVRGLSYEAMSGCLIFTSGWAAVAASETARKTKEPELSASRQRCPAQRGTTQTASLNIIMNIAPDDDGGFVLEPVCPPLPGPNLCVFAPLTSARPCPFGD